MSAEVLSDKKSWDEAKNLVRDINREFYDIVERIKPDDSCLLYVVNFPYGALIGDHISQFLPLKNGEYLRLNDPSIPLDLLNDLGYGKDNSPIAMIINKKIELYIDLPEKRWFYLLLFNHPGICLVITTY